MLTGTILSVSAFFAILAFFCGEYETVGQLLSNTFTPRSMKEFLMPRCGFCWVVRIGVTAAVIVNVI